MKPKKTYFYGKFHDVELEVFEDHAIIKDNRRNITTKFESIGKAFQRANSLKKEYKENCKIIRVTCTQCDAIMDEYEVENNILGISESSTMLNSRGIGADVLAFKCPRCGKDTESYRRG